MLNEVLEAEGKKKARRGQEKIEFLSKNLRNYFMTF